VAHWSFFQDLLQTTTENSSVNYAIWLMRA
jgi:hypothetical protein